MEEALQYEAASQFTGFPTTGTGGKITAGGACGCCQSVIGVVQTLGAGQPYFKADQVLVTERAAEGVNSIADLSGKRIGALIGSAAQAALDKLKDKYSIRLVSFRDQTEAVTDMLSGNVNAVVLDLTYARILTHEREYRNKLKIVGQPIATEDFGVVVKKGNREVLTRLNRGLKKVVESGQLKELEQKWFD